MNPLALLNFVPAAIKGVAGYFQEKQQIKKAKEERKDELKKISLETKLEGIRNASESDMKMDEESNERIAWADDVSFAVFLAPALLSFWPPALPHISAGFQALGEMPVWYQYALGMMLISVWGYRRLVTPIILAYFGKKQGPTK